MDKNKKQKIHFAQVFSITLLVIFTSFSVYLFNEYNEISENSITGRVVGVTDMVSGRSPGLTTGSNTKYLKKSELVDISCEKLKTVSYTGKYGWSNNEFTAERLYKVEIKGGRMELVDDNSNPVFIGSDNQKYVIGGTTDGRAVLISETGNQVKTLSDGSLVGFPKNSPILNYATVANTLHTSNHIKVSEEIPSYKEGDYVYWEDASEGLNYFPEGKGKIKGFENGFYTIETSDGNTIIVSEKYIAGNDYKLKYRVSKSEISNLESEIKSLEKKESWYKFGLFESEELKKARKAHEEALKEYQSLNKEILKNYPNSETANSIRTELTKKENYDISPFYIKNKVTGETEFCWNPWAKREEQINNALAEIEVNKRYEEVERGLKEQIEGAGVQKTLTEAEKQEIRGNLKEQILKEFKDKKFKEELHKHAEGNIAAAAHKLLNMVLGDYAYDYISDMCKEDWESSEPHSNTPVNTNPGPNDPLNPEENGECGRLKNNVISAQGKKEKEGDVYSYKLSWSLLQCSENLQYVLYIANSQSEKEEIGYGKGINGTTVSDILEKSSENDYKDVCFETNDNTVGTNGFVCFPLIDMVDRLRPRITSFSLDKQSPKEEESVLFSVSCSDNMGISSIFFADNITGVLLNTSYLPNIDKKSASFTAEHKSVLPVGAYISGMFTCVDTSENSIQSKIKSYVIMPKSSTSPSPTEDKLKPSIVSFSVNNSNPYSENNIEYNTKCRDETSLEGIYFAINISGKFVNSSKITGQNKPELDLNVVINNPGNSRDKVSAVVTCVDKAGNSIQSKPVSYTVNSAPIGEDNNPPTYFISDIDNTAPKPGDSVKYSVTCGDDKGIYAVYFAHNDSGSFVNHSSKMDLSDKLVFYNVNITASAPVGKVVGGVFTCEDYAKNSVQSDVRRYVVS